MRQKKIGPELDYDLKFVFFLRDKKKLDQNYDTIFPFKKLITTLNNINLLEP